jgi:hypothetical protein
LKIKCPYCSEEFTYYRDMQKHFVRLDHKTLPAMKYAELIFKIHELAKNCDGYIGCSELKSLLEGEPI